MIASRALLAGRYRAEALLATGGGAEVYGAHDERSGRPVALKIARSAGESESLASEGRLLARLGDPALPTCFDISEVDGRTCLALELLRGSDLDVLGGSHGITDVDVGIAVAIELCRIVERLHRAGVVHGDLKPRHVLVEPSGRLRLLDLGRAGGADHNPHGAEDGVVLGSARYLAPEVRAGEPPAVASDLYALGVTLYRALLGCPPFTSDDPLTLARQHAGEAPPSPRSLRPDLPAHVDETLLALLTKDPAARPATAGEVARMLTRDL